MTSHRPVNDANVRELRLFDDFERTDATPATQQEGSFRFLNRVATPWWSEVRELLEAWFADYAKTADGSKVADLRARFQSTDGRQHHGAWWELYLHAFLRRVYPASVIEAEPDRVGYTTRPDFCVTHDSMSSPALWLEAVTGASGPASVDPGSPAEAYVLDTINEVQCRDFRVGLAIQVSAVAHPKKRAIQDPLRRWLGGLDRDEVLQRRERGLPFPRFTLPVGDWVLEFDAHPKGRPGLAPGDRLIGFGPSKGGLVDDAGRARAAISRKGGHYEGLSAPLIVGFLPLGGGFDFEDAVGALFGSEAVRFDPADHEGTAEVIRRPDGLWSAGSGEVSAVLIGARVMPWTVATQWPTLWVNPTPARAFEDELGGVPRVVVRDDDGALESLPPVVRTPAQLFGLPDGWPGEDPWRTT